MLYVSSTKFVSRHVEVYSDVFRLIFVLKPKDTLFNLGKAEGSIDAGQMIKPALARGLQLVGATTRESLSNAR